MVVRRPVGLLALVFGAVGAAGCAAGGYGVWRVWSRLDRANEALFAAVDRGLGAVEDRLPAVRQWVRESKLTAEVLAEAVRGWVGRKAQDRLVAELEVEARAERRAGRLAAADLRLVASADAVLDIRRLLEIGQGLGARVDPAVTDDVLERLAVLRAGVQQAGEAVEQVGRFAAPGEGPVEDRLARAARLLALVLLTLTEVDRRLDEFAARLAEVRLDAGGWGRGRAATSGPGPSPATSSWPGSRPVRSPWHGGVRAASADRPSSCQIFPG
ncbi:MAG: hypothetical protein K2X87_25715 [Gemmataceae bacterium]|nr:hypothetical protein [Gemmataceae bacterium]